MSNLPWLMCIIHYSIGFSYRLLHYALLSDLSPSPIFLLWPYHSFRSLAFRLSILLAALSEIGKAQCTLSPSSFDTGERKHRPSQLDDDH